MKQHRDMRGALERRAGGRHAPAGMGADAARAIERGQAAPTRARSGCRICSIRARIAS